MIRIACKECAQFLVLRRYNERHVLGAGIAQHPFHIAIDAQLALGTPVIGDGQA